MIKDYSKYIESSSNDFDKVYDDIKINVYNKNQLVDNLIHNFSLMIKKRKLKSVRIKSIDGYINKESFFKKRGYVYETYFLLTLTNKDVVIGKYNSLNNNIIIKINDNVVYDIDFKTFDNEVLIDKMVSEYIKFLKKNNYLIKENKTINVNDYSLKELSDLLVGKDVSFTTDYGKKLTKKIFEVRRRLHGIVFHVHANTKSAEIIELFISDNHPIIIHDNEHGNKIRWL